MTDIAREPREGGLGATAGALLGLAAAAAVRTLLRADAEAPPTQGLVGPMHDAEIVIHSLTSKPLKLAKNQTAYNGYPRLPRPQVFDMSITGSHSHPNSPYLNVASYPLGRQQNGKDRGFEFWATCSSRKPGGYDFEDDDMRGYFSTRGLGVGNWHGFRDKYGLLLPFQFFIPQDGLWIGRWL